MAEQLVLRLPVTLQVAGAGMLAGTLLALPLGVLAAVRREGGADHTGRLLALVGSAFPSFWIGLLLMWVCAVQLRLLPVAGWRGPAYVVLPMVTLGLGLAGPLSRMVRATMLGVLREDYVRTGRAKGLREWQVLYVHALRNALPPVVSMLGLAFGHLLGGVVIIETVFGIPGMGRLAVEAIATRDYPTMQGVVLYLAVVYVAVNLTVDVVHQWLEPKLRPA